MENTTKILAGATCALAVTAVGGLWFYGIYAAGKSFDETAIGHFRNVLPAELSARVTKYEGGFFKKNFDVSFEAVGGVPLGAFHGVAYPGINTKVVLTRAPDINFEQSLLRGGVQNFDDVIELSYSAWDALRARSLPLPSAHLTYKIKPFTIVADGQCSFEEFRFDIETGRTVKISASTPGLSCRPIGQPELKLGRFDFSFVSQAEPIAKALNGEDGGLAETSLKLSMGPMFGGAFRHDGVELDMKLFVEPKSETWTETVDFKFKNPTSPALFLELGQLGEIDYIDGTMRIAGITPQLSDLFSQGLLAADESQADWLTLAVIHAIESQGLSIALDPLAVSVRGNEAVVSGTIAGEKMAGANQIVGRFAFEASEGIVLPDILADALAQGFLKRDKDKIRSEIVLTPQYGTANGLQLY